MNKSKNICLMCIMALIVIIPMKGYAFDFDNDPKWKIFNAGSKNTYTTTVKNKEIVWGSIVTNGVKYRQMNIARNGVTLSELKELAKGADVKLQFHKYSDGSVAMICTGEHDVTGHTLVMMVEPKNRYAYVYDTVSCISEVVDLGEAVQVYKGRTLIPIRKFIETFGGKVIYQGKVGEYDVIWPSLHK